MGEFAKTYSQMTDDQLLALYLERDELLPEARSALLAELQKRSLTESDAATLAEHMAAVESGRKSGEAPGEADQDSDTGSPKWEATAESQEADTEGVKRPPLEIVFGTADAPEAQVVQGLLESNGFEVTIQRALGGISDFVSMQLLVATERADDARRLIAQSRREALEAAVESEAPGETMNGMVPNARRAAGEDDKAAVTRVLTDYYSAFSTLDVHAIPPYFHEPSVLIVPVGGVIATPTHAAITAVFTAFKEALQTRGFARSELTALHVKRLSATTMLAGGIAVRYKTDGQELDRAGVTYLLHKADSRWKIAVVVVHDVDSVL